MAERGDLGDIPEQGPWEDDDADDDERSEDDSDDD
jgi:hypothetical protein